jgi:exoribonuclease-2
VYGEQKVREKDVLVLHEGPCTSLETVLNYSDDGSSAKLLEAYELLMSDESTAAEAISLSDLAEYSLGSFKADEAWFLFSAACNDLHFQLSQESLKNGEVFFTLRSAEEIEALNKKQYEKEHEAEIRAAFIKRVRARKLDLPEDAKFMGEVEAFALCKTDKSKVLNDAGLPQTIEAAHRLLIDTGVWDFTKNPYLIRKSSELF